MPLHWILETDKVTLFPCLLFLAQCKSQICEVVEGAEEFEGQAKESKL